MCFNIKLGAMQDETLPDMAYVSYIEQFKKKIKELREERGWTQEDLAQEMGISLLQYSAGRNRGTSLPALPAVSYNGFSRRRKLMAREVSITPHPLGQSRSSKVQEIIPCL